MAINNLVKIKCSVLFDITQTNVSHRRMIDVSPELVKHRNQQSNFETILQIISLRCQPEDITKPVKINNSPSNSWAGGEYRNKNKCYWVFEFSVHQRAVFEEGDDRLAKLFQDCQGVPLITGLEESIMLISHLDVTPELKNITFEIISDENGN